MNPVDKSNMLQSVRDFPAQCREALALGTDIKIKKEEVDNVIVCGMGGSAVAGDMLESYMRFLKNPIKRKNNMNVFVQRGYELPQTASKKSLVFIGSYSGNTEEIISCYKKAYALGAKIVAVSSNGQLQELALKNNVPFVKIPSGIQPRLAIGYSFFPMLNILIGSGIIDVEIDVVREAVKGLAAEPLEEEAEKLANKLVGKIPLVYSSDNFAVIARYWKNNFNECSKIHSFWNTFPELNHNEIVGYTNMKEQGRFHAIIIQDSADLPRIQQRMKLTRKLMEEKGGKCTMMNIKGKTFLGKLISTLMLGMYVSYFLALEYGIDPTPVRIIEDLKQALK